MPVDSDELPIQLVSFLTHAGLRSARDERELLLSLSAMLESIRGRPPARTAADPARIEGTEAERRSALSVWSGAMERMWRRFTAPAGAESPTQRAAAVRGAHDTLFDAWVRAHLPAACRAIELSQHPQRGRGLMARARVRMGGAALSVPSELLLHAGAVDGSVLGAALLSLQRATRLHDDRLLLLLLLALRRGAASSFGPHHQQLRQRWADYLAVLGDGPFGHALEWTEAERAAIAGTPLAAEVDAAHAQLASLHDSVARGQGAAARRSRRVQWPGLAAVGVLGSWAAWRVRQATPASGRGRRAVGRMVRLAEARGQHGGGVAALVPARSHQSRARWEGVRSQRCCDCCGEDGALRCSVCAIDDLCACCRRVPARVRCDMLEYTRAIMS